MSISTIEVNTDYLTTPYKQYDEENELKIGTWLALFARVTISNGKITFQPVDKCNRTITNECLLAPMMIKLDTRGEESDISIRITYRYGAFSHWDNNDEPHWITQGIDTIETIIPAYSGEGYSFLVGVYDSCEVLNVELLSSGDIDVNFQIFGLASTNTKLLQMINFDRIQELVREMFLNRFVYYLPSWSNENEMYLRGRLILNDKVAENRAIELKVERKGSGESNEKFAQRIQGKRYWVVPRNHRYIDSNIHYLMARYLDLSETDIYIYEKAVNIKTENPDESDRDRIWELMDEDGWDEDNGISYEDKTLIYTEDILNKNFETRLYISSINGIDQDWLNIFDNDGQFNNTEQLRANESYCFIVGNRGAPTDNRGYSAFSQHIDFTEMTQIRLDFRMKSIPNQLFTPPGYRLGRFWIVASTRRLSGYSNKIQELITSGTVLYEHVLYQNDYPTPNLSRINLDVSALTGKYYLYFIVKADWQFVEAAIDRIHYDYGTATSISPIVDTGRNDGFSKIYPFYTLNDPAATIEWRCRLGGSVGELYDSDWSEWRDITNIDFTYTGRYIQYEFRFESNVVIEDTPVEIDGFSVLGAYFPYHNIILDPTYTVSIPAENRGDNYMWSYASGDQSAFKEIVDSTCPAGITARTEFYLDEIEDVL